MKIKSTSISNIFISGEYINLTIPTDSDIEVWSTWFNDSKITSYLPQGLFPNTTEDQLLFLKNAKDSKRILLMVKTKAGELLGVASISNIDNINRSCQLSSVMPIKSKDAPLASIEARSLCVTHAFEMLNVERCWHASVYPGNLKWICRNILLGFIPEGIQFDAFLRYQKMHDVLNCSLSSDRYMQLKQSRGGTFWPGAIYFENNEINLESNRNLDKFIINLYSTRKLFIKGPL